MYIILVMKNLIPSQVRNNEFTFTVETDHENHTNVEFYSTHIKRPTTAPPTST